MNKKFPQISMALVCAIVITFASCKKELAIQPEDATLASRSKLSTTSVPVLQNSLPSFALGVNGHPLGDIAYFGVPASNQIEMIKKMGMGIYRINIFSTSDGTCTVPLRLQPLLDAAAAGKVTLLPMLQPRTLIYSDTEAAAYEKGKTLGGNFANKYAAVFKYYDLGNDLDVNTILSGKDGRLEADYDQNKLRITAAYLKGMSEGIHANDPDAQTMISAGWLHWGFIKFCESYGVIYDVLAYHWYSDMEASIIKNTFLKIPDITLKLNSLFPGKPIWITEANFRPSDLTTLEADQNKFLTTFIAKCKANPTVKTVIVYQLFDEPYKNGGEKHYGIVKWVLPYTQWTNKLVADAFEKNAASNNGIYVPISPPAPVITELFSNLLGYTATKPQASLIALGTTYYTDRIYQIKSIPSYLANASLIKTANNDKTSSLSSFISFNLNRSATVYVAYDPRATKLPTWLQGFTKLTDKFEINDPKLAGFNLYKKDYTAGSVTLGANLSGGATGALCQYVLMVK